MVNLALFRIFGYEKRRICRNPPIQYPDPGSNRDGLPHWCLRPARLPIPPSGQLLFRNCDAKVMLFVYQAKKNVFFLKKTFNCLPISLKKSNFAGRLLSARPAGSRYLRSLSLLQYAIQPIGRANAKRVSVTPNSVRFKQRGIEEMELLTN